MPSPRINTRLPPALYQRLEAEAARRQVPLSQVVQQALEQFLAQGPLGSPARGMPLPTSGMPASAQDGARPSPEVEEPLPDGTPPPPAPRMTWAALRQRIAARQARHQPEEDDHGD
jgi:hypothetical protein